MKDLMTSVGGPGLMTSNNYTCSSSNNCNNEKDAGNLHQHSQQQQHQHHQRPVTPETLTGTSSSSASFEEVVAELENFAPSSVCQQRKLSAAIVTRPDASHDFVGARPKVTVTDLSSSNSNSNTSSSNNHACFDTPPPKQQRTGTAAAVCPNTVPTTTTTTSTSAGGQQFSKRNHDDFEAASKSSSSHRHPPGPVRQHSVPINATKLTHVVIDPPAVRVDAWSEAPATSYNVRSSTYLVDHKKLPSEEALFSLLSLDLIQAADERPIMNGLCHHPNERIQRALRRERETGERELPEFIFAVNLAVPGPPVYHLVAYFGCNDLEAIKTNSTPLGRIANKFFFGNSDEYRDNTFKLIPRIVEGNYIVKKAVGSKPTILGRKLKQHYIRHPRFMELIVDIGSDSIARNVVGLSMGYAKGLIVDMMFLLEATEEETLPERILGGVRLKNLCFKKRDGQRKVKSYV